MARRLRVALCVLVLAGAGVAGGVKGRGGAPDARMAAAAGALLGSMDGELRSRCALPFDVKAREDWHFVPRERPGVRMSEMNDAQRVAARGLLRSALSSQGVLKVEQVMSLDAVLREIENNPGRDPLQYTFTIYGEPGGNAPWGWKVEGHHVSLNFTCVKGEVVGTTPSFLGASPAKVESGPRAGVRALAVEEDLGRELVRSLDAAQRAEAVIATAAPAEVITVPGRSLDGAPSAGIAYGKLTATQQGMLVALLGEYARTLRAELAEHELERIRAKGMEAVRFAWAGSLEAGQGHYYRITGPTFVIEYDNTQNNANHVHTVWHDRERDFGRDALREHYRQDHD